MVGFASLYPPFYDAFEVKSFCKFIRVVFA